jgi:hypothetical protein
MAQQGLNDQMQQHSHALVEMVHAELGWQLDYSEQSIGTIETLLDAFAKDDGDSAELIDNTALLYGSYIGEIIRIAFPKAQWVTSDAAPGGVQSPLVAIEGIQVFPITWCYKRLYNGPPDSVVDKYLAFREAIDARLAREAFVYRQSSGEL